MFSCIFFCRRTFLISHAIRYLIKLEINMIGILNSRNVLIIIITNDVVFLILMMRNVLRNNEPKLPLFVLMLDSKLCKSFVWFLLSIRRPISVSFTLMEFCVSFIFAILISLCREAFSCVLQK